MSTFWVAPGAKKATSSSGDTDPSPSINGDPQLQESIVDADAASLSKNDRLVDWIVQMLQEQIVHIVRLHKGSKKKKSEVLLGPIPGQKEGQSSLDEVVEVIELPAFDPKAAADRNKDVVVMDDEVRSLLRTYVTIIASAYHENPFHNFEHACHVTMNVVRTR